MKHRFYRFSEMNPYVRETGSQRYDSWKNRQRVIYDHVFYYCYSGKAYMTVQNHAYTLVPGSLLLISPNQPHSFWVDECDPGDVYYVHFDFFYREDSEELIRFYSQPDLYLSLFGNRPLERGYVRERPVFEGDYRFPTFLQLDAKEELEYLFRDMVRIDQRRDPHYEIRLKSALLELLYRILRKTSQAQEYVSSEQRMLVEQMKDYVRSHYMRELRVEQVVSITRLNPDYSSRIFRTVTGMRLVEYIVRYRISKAKELMLEPGLSMNDILTQVGFTDENYFCRVIKRYEGKTPTQLRKWLIETHITPEGRSHNAL